MDFTLSPDQELLRDTGRALVREHCPSSLVRAYAEDPSVADDLTARLSEFAGLVTGPAVDLCLFLEEMGAALVPGPFVPTVALFAPVVAAVGANDVFERVAAGEATGTVWSPSPLELRAPAADRVELVAIAVESGDICVTDQFELAPLEVFDLSRPSFDVKVASDSGTIGHGSNAALYRATVAFSAELIGTTRWMFETTLEYVKTREQFGRPIGSFQALQHRLADMSLLFERAWSSVYWAAMAIDADDDEQHRAVHVAKSSASEAARHIAGEAVQMHGGIGVTWDHDLHLYMRRAFASDEILGTTAWHRARLADLVMDASK
jgi:alkylation response protein AidB-like acyl-CoA dehydrogenase